MTISNLKLADSDFTAVDVKSLPDNPSASGISAAQLKATFDHVAEKLIAVRLNGLIDALVGTGGAGEIGIATIPGLSGINVQAALAAIKVLIDDCYTISAVDGKLALKFDTANAQDLVKTVAFNPTTGVFTITKYNNTQVTIDTAMEKIALNVALDGDDFVLTLVDGTQQRVSLSAFIKQTEFSNTSTITFSIAGGIVSANIAGASIGLAHLSNEVLASMDAKVALAQTAATNASASEANALAYKNAAAVSETNAKTSETAAKASEIAASNSALSAETARTSAVGAADRASVAATKAESEANRAKAEADRAASIVGGDFATKTEAQGYATQAKNDAIAVADTKVAQVAGQRLITDAEATKLAGIESGANKTIIADNLTTVTKGNALDASQGKVLLSKTFNFDNLIGFVGFNYSYTKQATADGKIITEYIKNTTDSTVYATRTNTKVGNTWTVLTVCSAMNINITETWTKEADGTRKAVVS